MNQNYLQFLRVRGFPTIYSTIRQLFNTSSCFQFGRLIMQRQNHPNVQDLYYLMDLSLGIEPVSKCHYYPAMEGKRLLPLNAAF